MMFLAAPPDGLTAWFVRAAYWWWTDNHPRFEDAISAAVSLLPFTDENR